MKVVFKKREGYNTYVGLQFAEVDRKDNIMIDQPQKCKEIFAYNKSNADGRKRFRFLITYTYPDKQLQAKSTQDFLNQVEQEMGFSKSRVWSVDGAPEGVQALLVDCSGRWLQNSPLFHLLLLLARNGSKHKLGRGWRATMSAFRRGDPFQDVDRPQFMLINDVIPHILSRKGNLEAFTYNADNEPRISKIKSWQKGLGICGWAEHIKQVGVI